MRTKPETLLNRFDALMVAAAGGHYDVLTALLKAKAEPNNKNKASGTALHEAAAIANAKVVGQV